MAKQLELPPRTLQLPQVNETVGENDVPPPGNFPKFPGLSTDQLNQALIEIAKAGHERQKLHGTQIRICVDGVDQDGYVQVEPRSWLRRGGLSRVSLHPTARRLEFYATHRDSRKEIIVSYLSLPSTHVEDGIKWKSTLRLGGGQKVVILIEPQLDEAGFLARSILTVYYNEPPSILSLREWYCLNTARLNEVVTRPLWAGVLTFVFVMVVGAVGYLSLERGSNSTKRLLKLSVILLSNVNGSDSYQEDDLDRAIKDSTHLISLNPKDAAAYNTRGSAYARKGDFETAIQDFTKSILRNSKDASVYRNRAEAYRALGRKILADKDEKKAQRLGGLRNLRLPVSSVLQ